MWKNFEKKQTCSNYLIRKAIFQIFEQNITYSISQKDYFTAHRLKSFYNQSIMLQ